MFCESCSFTHGRALEPFRLNSNAHSCTFKTFQCMKKSPKKESPKKQEPPKVQSMMDDPKCISLRKKLMEKEDFEPVDVDDLNRLISHCREYSQYCAIQEDYAEALRAQALGEHAREELTKRTTKVKSTSQDLERQKETRAEFEERWKKNRDDYQRETKEKVEQLQAKHEHETRVFEKNWKHTYPQRYRKPSQRLLQLKQIEKSLAVSCEIQRAAQVHEQVEAMTRVEVEKAQAALIRDYQVAKGKHFAKQQEEMQRLLQTREEGRKLMEADFQSEERTLAHRDWVLESKTREALIRARAAETPPTRSSGVPKEREARSGTLLPKLMAPNDPQVKENERQRRSYIREQRREFQKREREKEEAFARSFQSSRNQSRMSQPRPLSRRKKIDPASTSESSSTSSSSGEHA